jgi:prepilin-type N-terminal cleavage/methylation domain-containing protein
MKKRGFTLIELLVVIAIIGILAAMILTSLAAARVRARDAVRKSDLNQIATALEVYASDNEGTYPAANAAAEKWSVGFGAALNKLVTSKAISAAVKPPRSTDTYGYITNKAAETLFSGSCNGTATGAAADTQYALEARLESPKVAGTPIWQVKSNGNPTEVATGCTALPAF